MDRFLTALPVFNEETHIHSVLKEVRKYSQDLLVVDDGSTDHTPEILANESDLLVLTHEVNHGYGAALNSAFQYAIRKGYDALVTIDCDGQHEPALIPELVAQLEPAEGEFVDIVSGSRYLEVFQGDSVPPADRREINATVTEHLNELLHTQLTDAFCGFKAYRVPALKVLSITEFGYAMPLQLWVQAVVKGLKIVEFPVPLVYLEEERSFGGSLDDARRRLAYYRQVLQRELATVPESCGFGAGSA